MPLTDTRIRSTKPQTKPLKVADGSGLHLEVRPTGSKLWRYRYRLHGKESVFAIGEYPAVSLADARKARDDAKSLVKQGVNPAHNRKLDRLKATHASKETFKAVALEWDAVRIGIHVLPAAKNAGGDVIARRLLCPGPLQIDPGDDEFTWIALEDESGGRVKITALIPELAFPPVTVVETRMLVEADRTES